MPRVDRPPCGTEAGYSHHTRFGHSCPVCSAAHDERQARARLAREPDRPLQYRAVLRGFEVAEALTTADRARLVTELHQAGWTDVQVARHTRLSTFTAGEIRQRLGLAPNQPSNDTERTA